jgi:hypothetical protein
MLGKSNALEGSHVSIAATRSHAPNASIQPAIARSSSANSKLGNALPSFPALTFLRYVEALVVENERLRKGSADAVTAPVPDTGPPNLIPDVAQDGVGSRESLQNPLFEERPWFHTVSSLGAPIHVGEASDAAFATRFRQTLDTVCTNHIPRMNFVPDAQLLVLSESQYSWPKPARARFLVKVAFSTICRYYHMIRKSVVLESLEVAIKNGGNGDRLVICKLLALFALGEAYSARTAAQEAKFPGIAYFAQARRMVTIPSERPELDTVEVALLLVSVYHNPTTTATHHYDHRVSTRTRSTDVTQHTSLPALRSGLVSLWACR